MYCDLYFSGTTAGGNKSGTAKNCPVRGGKSFSLRARWVKTEAKFPPAEAPPTTKPFEGVAFSADACSAA